MVSAEQLLLNNVKLSRSLQKTYNSIKSTQKGTKNEKYYALCILSTYKMDNRPITMELKKELAMKCGLSQLKLDSEFKKFYSKLPKTDKQIAMDIVIKLKASISINDKFTTFKSKYLETLTPQQQESTSIEPLAVVTLYMENSKHNKTSKPKYLKECKIGSPTFDKLCQAYELLMMPQLVHVKPKPNKQINVAELKKELKLKKKLIKNKKNKFVDFHEVLFKRCIPFHLIRNEE